MSFGDWLKRVFSRQGVSLNMVRYYDTERERVVEIPASELAPGVVQVQMEGIEGVVWIETDKLNQGDLRQPPLSKEDLVHVRRIRTALQEHRNLTLEEWEEGFRRDANPAQEIALWSHAADVYLACAESEPSPERRKGIYECVVTCLVASPETVRHVLRPSALTQDETSQVVRTFFGE